MEGREDGGSGERGNGGNRGRPIAARLFLRLSGQRVSRSLPYDKSRRSAIFRRVALQSFKVGRAENYKSEVRAAEAEREAHCQARGERKPRGQNGL